MSDPSGASANGDEDEGGASSTPNPSDNGKDDDDDDASGSEDDGSDPSSSVDSVDDLKFDLGSVPDGGTLPDSDCPCADNSDLIHLLDEDGELWVYDPIANAFSQLGGFDCPDGPGDSPFSMGVARDGKAWVQMSPTGDIFHVDTRMANECVASDYQPDQAGFRLFGMAFVSHEDDEACDRLFAHSFDGSDWSQGQDVGMLGQLEPDTLAMTELAKIDYNGGELTGTGDGRLFAFAGVPDAQLIEYDRLTGEVIEIIELGELELTNAFAFAFWGGDFYFFTEKGFFPPVTSKVTRLDHDGDMSLTTVNEDAPIRVVGAGVSTCAPIVPPGRTGPDRTGPG